MEEWVEVLKERSSLSSLKAKTLAEVMERLPFIEDLTGGALSVYARGKKSEGYALIFGEEVEFKLIEESFETGKVFNQWEESEEGGFGVRSFPVRYGKEIIAVILAKYRLTMPMSDFLHILHAADACLSFGSKFDKAVWKRLDKNNGIVYADRFHRIVFADDVSRHIYRILGVSNLIGRSVLDEDLKKAVTEESFSKKTPWEKKLIAGENVFLERRLDFTEGGEVKGHLVILRDITAEKKREQDEKVQAALLERIAELENELEDIKNSLAARKLVDRAKGYLMDKYKLTEEESYRKIQRLAMTNRKTIKEVAEEILKEKK